MSPSWHEFKNVIYLTVETQGIAGEEWILRLKRKGVECEDDAKNFLLSHDFETPEKVQQIMIVKRTAMHPESGDIRFHDIDSWLRQGELVNPELACYLCEFITQHRLSRGISQIMIMHASEKESKILCMYGIGDSQMRLGLRELNDVFNSSYGFAFIAGDYSHWWM